MFSRVHPSQSKRCRNRLQQQNRRVFQHLEDRRLLAAGADDLAPLSDEFDDASSVSAWTRIHQSEGWNADQLQVYDINQTQPGNLVMQPHTVTWYRDWRGPLSYKNVTGDFVITTEVSLNDRDDLGDNDADRIPDDAQFSLGGLMIRTPREITNPSQWTAGGENYAFFSLGHGTDGGFSYEVKTTTASNSDLRLSPTSVDTATIQIARIGDQIILLRRGQGEDWVVQERYSRPDMPETLQVGLVSYSDWEKAGDFSPEFHNANILQPGVTPDPTPGEPFNPDLIAAFDYARFARPEIPAELNDVDLVNVATEQQLLSFLGDVPNQPAQSSDEPLVLFRLEITNEEGLPLDQVTVGDDFYVDVLVDDQRVGGTGVFSAYLDISFDGNLANTTGPLEFGEEFPNAQEGSVSSGLVNEVGAIADDTPSDESEKQLVRIPLSATSGGELTFRTDAADLLPEHEIGLYGFDNPVDESLIVFGSTVLTINPAVENDLPVAKDDQAQMFHDDGPVTIDVLANDTTEPGEVLSIVELGSSDPDKGVFQIVENQIQFNPAAGFTGLATVSYTIDDGNGGQGSAVLDVTVDRRWHLTSSPYDTNNDGSVSPLDALRIINIIYRFGTVDLAATSSQELDSIPYYPDINDDGRISALDALVVINELGRRANSRQESEFVFAHEEDEMIERLAADQVALF